jgi:hypothetical protein
MKIKKQYKQDDGTLIEVEGEEWEIEAYEKKQAKKNESLKKKKEILHGKAAEEILKIKNAMNELKKFIVDELIKLQTVREVHHWHYNNGYWWRPWYTPIGPIYFYSNINPNNIADSSMVFTCNSVAELSSKIGIAKNLISAPVTSNFSSFTVTSPRLSYGDQSSDKLSISSVN